MELKEALKTALGAAEGALAGGDVEEGGEGDGFAAGVLKKKKRQRGEEAVEEGPGGGGGGEGKAAKVEELLDEYFGREETRLSEADRFLKRYLRTQAWKRDGDDDGGGGSDSEEVFEDGEDGPSLGGEGGAEGFEEEEEFLEQADRFEAAYNFRWGPGEGQQAGAGGGAGGKALSERTPSLTGPPVKVLQGARDAMHGWRPPAHASGLQRAHPPTRPHPLTPQVRGARGCADPELPPPHRGRRAQARRPPQARA
jgi:hypothetical protein